MRRQGQFAKAGITDRLNDPWPGCHLPFHYTLQNSPAEQNLGKMTPAGDCRVFKVTSVGLSFPRSIPVASCWHLLIRQSSLLLCHHSELKPHIHQWLSLGLNHVHRNQSSPCPPCVHRAAFTCSAWLRAAQPAGTSGGSQMLAKGQQKYLF